MADATDIARSVLDALGRHRPIAPFTDTDPGFDLAAAYRAAAEVTRLRDEHGETVVGRKIGFTNRTIWDEYGVHAPIWGNVYDTTLHRLDVPFDLACLMEPRIEPEVVLRLAAVPTPGLDLAGLAACVSGFALGFELVQSIFPGWRFAAADTVAAFGLHGALLCGPFVPLTADLAAGLADFRVTLRCNGTVADEGHAANILGAGPLAALAHLAEVLAADSEAPPLAPGEIVSTGTLTRALPIAAGQTWEAVPHGLPLPPIRLSLA